tara:strand:+ start:43772 stop:44776 length:1005 start_codon:yes stop_codon:yes gene_type:complete
MTIISFSQSWIYKEDGNAFDGNYKFAAVEGKGSDFPYNNPILYIRKFDNGEPEFFLTGAGFFSYSRPIVLFNFDDEDNIYKSIDNGYSADGDAIFFNELDISFYEMFKKIKNGNKLFIRVQNENGKNDIEFSLSGSSKAVNFVIDRELFEQLKQESLDEQPDDQESFLDIINEVVVIESDVEIEEELEIEDIDTEDEEEIEFEEEEEVDEVIDFAVVEGSPIFPGCKPSKKKNISDRKEEDMQCLNKGIMKHIKKNFKYPEIAKQMGIQEKIYVTFVINKNGEITDVRVLRGEDKYLKEEAIRLVKSLPKMIPGNQRGEPVAVNYMIPINFMLN